MNLWLFSSRKLDNIKIAKDRLLWGFWDRDVEQQGTDFGQKLKRNWRNFIRLYNKIKPFDIVVFQISKSGDIHAIGIVKEKYFDDQTPVWQDEIDQDRVLYPWRISFSCVIFSEQPLITLFIKIENYIEGYGIGELPQKDFIKLLNAIRDKVNIDVNLG